MEEEFVLQTKTYVTLTLTQGYSTDLEVLMLFKHHKLLLCQI